MGFTLPELLITIAIIAILAVLAMPSFKTFIANQRIRSASFDLVAAMTLARSEAIKQNGDVTIASAGNTNAWSGGWTISGSGGTVKTQSAYPNMTITTGTGGAASIVYNRNGRISATGNINFQINDPSSGINPQSRCITLGPTGQPATKPGSC
jgi:type IV fimbrial biogenesis protein FimT